MSAGDAMKLCTFRVGTLLCGIALERVLEIARYQPMTPVPLAPAGVAGLINLRGQVVTVVDLRWRLKLPARANIEDSCNLVVQRGGSVMSLLIDEIGDVIDVPHDALLDPPQTLSQGARAYVQAVLESDEGLLLALDIDTTTSLELLP